MTEVRPEIISSQIENEASRTHKNETNAPPIPEEKYRLNFKLKQILCCVVCKELRRSSIFQCKYGHLICAGCFGDILAESKMQNEIATCPKCQSTISRESCSQNIAVEKTITELPRICQYCCSQVPPENYLHHQRMACDKRPTICCNNSIGCSWEGPFSLKFRHQEECKQLSASGYDILKSLIKMDQEVKKEVTLYEQIFELLSVETFVHFDLQFKRCDSMSTHDEKKVVFNSSKFSAFDNLFIVNGYLKEETSEFIYQLVLKNILSRNKSLNLHYLLIKGPYSEMEIKPKLCQFKFDEKSPETPFQNLTLWYNTESLKSYFSVRRINFRLFLFLDK